MCYVIFYIALDSIFLFFDIYGEKMGRNVTK